MEALLILVAAIGLVPLALGLARLDRPPAGIAPWPALASVLSCTLAFNLTFFWQELWLVIPKALTPGLSPILYHNDHDWSGNAPLVELLQGTGALATLVSGLAALTILATVRSPSPAWRLFLFWMAFQGLFQSLSQCAIGSILPGNDVGRAFAYLGASGPAKVALLGAGIIAMAAAGFALSMLAPPGLASREVHRTRAFGFAMVVTALACVVLSIPFRIPRNPIEVVLIPAAVNLIGTGWLLLGRSLSRRAPPVGHGKPGVVGPAAASVALLLVFHLVLRPGIRF